MGGESMRYTKEFKEEALKLSDEIGVRKTAEQLGLSYNTLTDWRNTGKNSRTDHSSARKNRHGESVNWNRNSLK